MQTLKASGACDNGGLQKKWKAFVRGRMRKSQILCYEMIIRGGRIWGLLKI